MRRSAEGEIENSTCMNNTASEFYMVDRLIVDDIVHWVKDYKVQFAITSSPCPLTPLSLPAASTDVIAYSSSRRLMDFGST